MRRIGKKQFYSIAATLLLPLCALLSGIDKGADGERGPAPAADFFAYTDSQNRLCLWKEGEDAPLFLTDRAFAVSGEEVEKPYWETWEHWQEWDEANRKWVSNEERALQGVVWEAPDKSVYFPQNMVWEAYGMQSGAKEREEMLAYAAEEELEDWVCVRAFDYDLYRKDFSAEQEAEKIAENVLFYSVDEKGTVWYCKASVDGNVQVGEETLSCARCVLYRYDGTAHQEIGEIDGRRTDPFRVGKNGDFVTFYGMDGGLYRCMPPEEPTLLAKGADAVLYRNEETGSLVYARDGAVYVTGDEGEEREVYAGKSGRQSIGALGKEGNLLFVMEAAEHVRYADWIEREAGEEDADTQRLWELFEQIEQDYYPFYCTVRVLDISVFPAETIDEAAGYVLTAPMSDEEGEPKDVYYMEMIPEDSFEKIPLSELLGDSLPGDVLHSYEYYLDNYGEGYREQAFAWGLEACWEREALEKRSRAYGIGKNGFFTLELPQDGVLLGDFDDYSADGEQLYLMQYVSPKMESDYRRYGHQVYYGYLESRYALDGDGNCKKVVELADESYVVGNEVFYSRNLGLEGYVRLYGVEHADAIATAAEISLESLQKSGTSDALLFLAEGLMTEEEEEIPVHAQADLWAAYRQLDIEQDRFGEEKDLHTLALYREGTVRELGQDVVQYAFYGADSIWMLQYENTEDSRVEDEDWEEEETAQIGTLFVEEKGEKRMVTDQAVWMIQAGCRENSRRASWVFG